MAFRAYYRGKDGKIETLAVDAPSRTEAFAELKKQGLSAAILRLEEVSDSARPRKASREAGGNRGTLAIKGLAAGLVVVIGALAAWYAFFRNTAPDTSSSGKEKPRAVAKVPREATVKPQASIISNTPSKTVQVKNEPQKVIHCVTNRQGKVIVISDEEWANFERAQRDTTLRTRTEKRLRLLASVPPGTPVPPMPGSSKEIDDEIVETLRNKIEILPDDTEREIQHKKFVMDFKEYIKGEMAQGKKASEAYNEYVSLMNSVAELTSTGAKMAREMRNEGDEEGAKKFLETVNARLESMGADPIDLDRRPKGMTSKEQKEPSK